MGKILFSIGADLVILMLAATASASADDDSAIALAAMGGLAVDPNPIHPAVPVVETLAKSSPSQLPSGVFWINPKIPA